MINTPILVIGAGPSGLMLSAQLQRYNAAHVIVEQREGITGLSKALGVQARSMEQYRQLGIADKAIAQGFIAETVRLVINGKIRAMIPLGEIGTGLSPYPYLFILEQSHNEGLLYDYIRAREGNVQWGIEVEEIKNTDTGYTGTLKRSDGTRETFECEYLIDCGGTSSPVRHFLNMPFRGATNEQLFFVADIDLEVDLEKQGLILAINGNEFLGFFPMSGTDQYRAIGALPDSVTDPENFSFDEIRTHIEENIGLPVKITGHSWYASYRVHHRIVDSFRSDNAFLVGDAAHIHSPAGGQGMNTGLGDAVNLGWKLAAVVNDWCEPEILDSYNQERRPFGVQLVNTTDKVFSLIVSKSWSSRYVRTYILPFILSNVLHFKVLRRLMFKTISQTRISYRKSSMSDGSRIGDIYSGDRFPWFEWDDGNSFDWLSNTGYVVLNFGGVESPDFGDWNGPCSHISVNGAAAEAAVNVGLPSYGSVIVRPDMHVLKIITE